MRCTWAWCRVFRPRTRRPVFRTRAWCRVFGPRARRPVVGGFTRGGLTLDNIDALHNNCQFSMARSRRRTTFHKIFWFRARRLCDHGKAARSLAVRALDPMASAWSKMMAVSEPSPLFSCITLAIAACRRAEPGLTWGRSWGRSGPWVRVVVSTVAAGRISLGRDPVLAAPMLGRRTAARFQVTVANLRRWASSTAEDRLSCDRPRPLLGAAATCLAALSPRTPAPFAVHRHRAGDVGKLWRLPCWEFTPCPCVTR